ncbi:MAG: class I SAM-dependent methyltransferase [Sphingobacteriales bacterium]|nr:MAG: class I SAM-dependent methyltransferase [Sphingobacteriales bacterium]
MEGRVHYSQCPLCDSRSIGPVLTATDYTVSKEEFAIWECAACRLRFTQDVPDAAHIGPFYKSEDYISHSNTSKGLINRLYQRVRRSTLRQKVALVQKATGRSSGRALDVGCGTGAFLNALRKSGWTVQGLEPDTDARALAIRQYGLDVQEASSLYNLPEGSFELITLWHVLEHVHDLQGYLAQLRKLLAPGGRLVVAVPNYTSGDAAIYGRYWAAYDVPRHLYHFAPESMKLLVQRHGMRVAAEHPMWYDAFYISLLSSRYRSGQTHWVGAPLAGLRSNAGALANKERCSSITYIIEPIGK